MRISIFAGILGGAAVLAACSAEPAWTPTLDLSTPTFTRTATLTAMPSLTATQAVVTPAFLTPAAPDAADLPEPPAAPFGRITLMDGAGDKWHFAYLDFDDSGKPGKEIRPEAIKNPFLALSPDGTRAAFSDGKVIPVSEYAGDPTNIPDNVKLIPQSAVYVADLSGGDPLLIAAGEPFGEWNFLQWSPDGQWVAGIHTHVEFLTQGISHVNGGLSIVRADGSGGPINLVSMGMEGTYTWAPDSRSLYLSGSGSILRVSLDGRKTRIFPREGETAWLLSEERWMGCGEAPWFDISDDGRWLATVVCGGEEYSIVIFDIESYSKGASAGSVVLRRPVNTKSNVLTSVGRIAVSPDGSRILFVEAGPDGAGLYLAAVVDGSVTPVFLYRTVPYPTPEAPNVKNSPWDPNTSNAVWSPDGQWVAFNNKNFNFNNNAQSGVYIISIVGLMKGEAPVRITGMMGLRTMQWVRLNA